MNFKTLLPCYLEEHVGPLENRCAAHNLQCFVRVLANIHITDRGTVGLAYYCGHRITSPVISNVFVNIIILLSLGFTFFD